MKLVVSLALIAGGRAAGSGASSADPCHADDTNTFHVVLDPHASEWGYFKFAECGDTAMPVLAMERGVTYTFDQSDVTNWYHPLGFAYFADGAHNDVDELEPGISMSGSACVDDNTCQAPMYYKNGEFLGPGGYDNSVTPITGGDGDFGLDFYEPEFFLPRGDWVDQGKYEVKLTLTDETYEGDLFYFCHIHNFMSGRIKVQAGGANVNAADAPELGYAHHVPTGHDAECGTVGLGDYADACDDRFVCDEGASRTQRDFGACLQAMDCHMNFHMRTVLHDAGPLATFVHQMIPHHQNAVNMAKALLATGALDDGGDRRRRRHLREEDRRELQDGDESEDGDESHADESEDEHAGHDHGDESEDGGEHEDGDEHEDGGEHEDGDEDGDSNVADLQDIVWTIINAQNHQIQVMEGIYESLVASDRDAARCSGDDDAWHKKGTPSKDCQWVGRYLPIRCAVKGADGSTACNACADTCTGQC